MEILQKRLESFSKSRRLRNPSKPSASATVKWPHPKSIKATPASLAEAGFYYSPSFEDRDSVTCFMCNKELSDWNAEDDPFDIHWQKCGSVCCWASVRCGLREDMDEEGSFIFPNDARLPGSKAMEKARLETFTAGEGWVHDQTRNHGASSKKMARAGFVYTPQHPGDDLATCLYCDISLSGWDKDDNPMQEHRAREQKLEASCPFFSIVESNPAPDSRPPSRSQSKPPSRTQSMSKPSKSKHQDVILPTKTHDGDPDSDSLPTQASTSKAVGKTPRKPRSTSSTKTPKASSARSRSRGELKHVEEETEEEDIGFAPPPEPPQKAKKTRSKSVSRSRPVLPAEEDETEEAENVAPKRHTRTRSKAKLIVDTEDEEETQAIGKKTRPAQEMDEDAGDILAGKAVREIPKAKYPDGLREGDSKPARSKPTKDMPPSHAPRQNSRSNSKSNMEHSPPDAGYSEEDLDSRPLPAAKPPSTRKASKTIAKAPPKTKPKMTVIDPPDSDMNVGDPNDGLGRKPEEEETQRFDPPPQTPTQLEPKNTTVSDLFSAQQIAGSEGGEPEMGIFTPKREYKFLAVEISQQDFHQPAPEVIEEVQVVEISTDEEGANDDRRGKPTKLPRPTASPRDPTQSETPDDPMEPAKVLINETTEEAQVIVEPISISKPILAPIAGDVKMGEASPPNVETTRNENLSPPTCPVTPPPSNHTPPAIFAQPLRPPVALPALSKLPFTPLTELTDAEMDMTVEEWVRYQMDVEYDKFKRDGEREVGRFKKRAEEVRRLILEL